VKKKRTCYELIDDTYKKELKWMTYIQKRVKMDDKGFNSHGYSKMLLIKYVMNLYNNRIYTKKS
jgi:hypothetical protein